MLSRRFIGLKSRCSDPPRCYHNRNTRFTLRHRLYVRCSRFSVSRLFPITLKREQRTARPRRNHRQNSLPCSNISGCDPGNDLAATRTRHVALPPFLRRIHCLAARRDPPNETKPHRASPVEATESNLSTLRARGWNAQAASGSQHAVLFEAEVGQGT
jgi:hypothetical protein